MASTLIVAAVVAVFLIYIRDLNLRHDRERQRLLTWIKAPDVAVSQAATDDRYPDIAPAHIRFDDDDSYWKQRETQGELV